MSKDWTTPNAGQYEGETLPTIALNNIPYFLWMIDQMDRFRWTGLMKAQAIHIYECMRSIRPPDIFNEGPGVVAYAFENLTDRYADCELIPEGWVWSLVECYTVYSPELDLTLPAEYYKGDAVGSRLVRNKAFRWLGLPPEDHEWEPDFCDDFFSNPSHFLYNEKMLFNREANV